jgi:hypothetical protein
MTSVSMARVALWPDTDRSFAPEISHRRTPRVRAGGESHGACWHARTDDRFLLGDVLRVSGLTGFLVLVVYIIVVWTVISVLVAAVGVGLGWRAQRRHVQAPPSEHVVWLDTYRVTHEARAREDAKKPAR